ncbi:NPP1 family protein [Streptomyces iconiensis]|uniref:NPP1 family protein n=1 Tax=Streptomyces iconiensis TaxID=1384038 RepID=A0ABT7A4W0_9ACTN|nr:NPP1 family protein [Streptomyces iconiensis]MDJ1136059.1 NPP1 family protein [Streptomyces iconiensis]
MLGIRNRVAVLVAATAASALLLTACGGDGGDSGGSDNSGKKPSSSAPKEQKADGAGKAGIGTLNEPLKEGPASLQDFAKASVPEWNFPRANSNDPCWPEDAFDSSGNPTDGAKTPNWPNSDGGCPKKGSPHPTYYTVKKCSPDKIRVSYTLYMATSGFQPSGEAGGHRHDFEHIDVSWKKNGDDWTRDQLLLSAHGEHRIKNWGDAESWNADRGSAGKGREFPRVFVGWGSHSMFNDQGGLKDVISQYTDNEYRHADYQSWADTNLVEVAPDGELYKKFKDNAKAWGSADGNPAAVADTMCTHDAKGNGTGR